MVISDAKKAHQHAKNEAGGKHPETKEAECWNAEVWRLAEKNTRHANGGSGCAESCTGNGYMEAADQFFENKDCTGDRCVEGCGEACPGTGCQENAALVRISPKRPPDELTYATAHLNGGPFAAECESPADGKKAAKEFHNDYGDGIAEPSDSELMLDIWDAAAASIRSKARDYPRGKGGNQSNAQNHQKKSGHTPGMGTNDEVSTPDIGSMQKKTERSCNKANKNADRD